MRKIIDELIKELQELQEYKKKYESAMKDKQAMSDLLYDYKLKEYNSKSYEDRCKEHIEKTCSACRYCDGCELKNHFPVNIRKPIPSDKAWIPGKQLNFSIFFVL